MQRPGLHISKNTLNNDHFGVLSEIIGHLNVLIVNSCLVTNVVHDVVSVGTTRLTNTNLKSKALVLILGRCTDGASACSNKS